MPILPPKRSSGPCTCDPSLTTHYADCPSLYPPQESLEKPAPERMTQNRLAEDQLRDDIAIVQTVTDTSTAATNALMSIEAEMDRARAEESCLREENATKDATIKALADELLKAARGFRNLGELVLSGPYAEEAHRRADEIQGTVTRLTGRKP